MDEPHSPLVLNMPTSRKRGLGCRVALTRLTVAALIIVLGAAGCRKAASETGDSGTDDSQTADSQTDASPRTAEQLVRRMVHTYQDTPRYRDDGRLELHYRQNRTTHQDSAPMAVAFERPNRLRFDVYQTRFGCDGQRLRAMVVDQQTDNLDGQVLDLPAPESLALPIVYGDGLLHEFLREGIAGYPVQLELLMAERPLQPVLENREALNLVGRQTIDGETCQGVSAEVGPSQYVFWIGTSTFLLRRLEFPVDSLREALSALGPVEQLRLTIDFTSASFDTRTTDDQLSLPLESDAKRVRHLVLPALAAAADRLGQPVGRLGLQNLDPAGDPFEVNEQPGRPIVLVWFSNHPASQGTLRQFQQVWDRYRASGSVEFAAVLADATLDRGGAQSLVDQWQLTVPVVRDDRAVGRDVLGILEAPTVVLIGADGRLQAWNPRANPNLENELSEMIERLLAGSDLAAETLARQRDDSARYQQQLAAAMQPADAIPVAAPRATITAAFPPSQVTLTSVWKNNQLTSPGNGLFVAGGADGRDQAGPNAAGNRLFMLDGWRTVVELDQQGNLIARRALDLPEGAGVNRIRSAQDPAGLRYFALFATLSPKVFLFDDQWQLVASHPPASTQETGIYDVELARAADDSLLMLVGFSEPLGIHAVTMSGRTAWTNRAFETVTSITAVPSSRSFLLTNELGDVLRLDDDGQRRGTVSMEQWPLVRLAGRGHTGTTGGLCGISHDPNGRSVAVAFDHAMTERWSYPLPGGTHGSAVEPIVATDLLGVGGEWLLVGADGTIHLVSCDGQFSDYFGNGAAIQGIAAGGVAGRPVLVLASQGVVECLAIEPNRPF